MNWFRNGSRDLVASLWPFRYALTITQQASAGQESTQNPFHRGMNAGFTQTAAVFSEKGFQLPADAGVAGNGTCRRNDGIPADWKRFEGDRGGATTLESEASQSQKDARRISQGDGCPVSSG